MKALALWTLVLSASLPTLARAELSDETLLGPGLRSRPAYDGSASDCVRVRPTMARPRSMSKSCR